jgi:hypothetical protein
MSVTQVWSQRSVLLLFEENFVDETREPDEAPLDDVLELERHASSDR